MRAWFCFWLAINRCAGTTTACDLIYTLVVFGKLNLFALFEFEQIIVEHYLCYGTANYFVPTNKDLMITNTQNSMIKIDKQTVLVILWSTICLSSLDKGSWKLIDFRRKKHQSAIKQAQ